MPNHGLIGKKEFVAFVCGSKYRKRSLSLDEYSEVPNAPDMQTEPNQNCKVFELVLCAINL